MAHILYKTYENKGRKIEYYLISDNYDSETTVYGISIITNKNEISIPDISPSEEVVRQLLDSMADGLVTPVIGKSVVED